MHNLFNGVLLHTLKFLLLDRDLFLMDLVVHERRRHVHGRKSVHNRRNKNFHDVLVNSLRSRCHMSGHRCRCRCHELDS